jgi:hypothetical protein
MNGRGNTVFMKEQIYRCVKKNRRKDPLQAPKSKVMKKVEYTAEMHRHMELPLSRSGRSFISRLRDVGRRRLGLQLAGSRLREGFSPELAVPLRRGSTDFFRAGCLVLVPPQKCECVQQEGVRGCQWLHEVPLCPGSEIGTQIIKGTTPGGYGIERNRDI